jgi:hypothetical protein
LLFQQTGQGQAANATTRLQQKLATIIVLR